MHSIAIVFTIITALLHGYFFVLESFLWTKPFGLKTFRMTYEQAQQSKVLASNQGLYNGLLAMGLLLSFYLPDEQSRMAVRLYCLSFIAIASLYGWYSVSFRIFLFQGIPALIAIAAYAAIF